MNKRFQRGVSDLVLVGLMLAGFALTLRSTPADDRPRPAGVPAAAAPAADNSPEVAAIRAQSAAFVDAFNRGDANAIAALWTPEGDYVDDSGMRYAGRAAIAAAYAEFFKSHPGAKLQVTIDSIRLLSPDSAIEDGRSMVQVAPPGAPGASDYTAIHVRVGGKWQMATVREVRRATSDADKAAADLGWLVGRWTAEEHGCRTESTCRWVADRAFIERSYTMTHHDGKSASGLQIIGWNPQRGCVQSWDYSPGGGLAVGLWEPHADGWSAHMQGMLSDGTPTTAVNRLTRLDDKAYVWQSVQRTLGGRPLPDTDEVVIRRQAN